MSTKADTPTWLGTHARVARTLLCVLGLVTLAFLYSAQPGQALEVAGTPIVNLPEDREEPFEELEEEGEEECEAFEEEFAEDEEAFEEECEEFEEDERSRSLPPSECRLRTASARVFTQARDRVSLVIGYTSFSPANVTIDYRLKGGKGSLKLGRTTRHFSKQGVVRITDKLSDSQMKKVKAARDFEVQIRIPAAPGYCRSYLTRHLDAKRKAHGQVVWFQSK
ncbi:MAG: hypothetical protein WD827_06675 [Solirubrobacterales bacterium]